ncbi:MAG: hypothetical protein JWN86_2233 [Planctomycetota bacterium]|nr:hypothetical protein [Planctomycetota bacterium]
MKEQPPVTRRRALIAASTVTAMGIATKVANADDTSSKSSGDRSRKPTPLKLKVTLTDGQVVTLTAAEVLIDFGANGQLLLKPDGVPESHGGQSDSQGNQKR